jgi:hypothetical protein
MDVRRWKACRLLKYHGNSTLMAAMGLVQLKYLFDVPIM